MGIRSNAGGGASFVVMLDAVPMQHDVDGVNDEDFDLVRDWATFTYLCNFLLFWTEVFPNQAMMQHTVWFGSCTCRSLEKSLETCQISSVPERSRGVCVPSWTSLQ